MRFSSSPCAFYHNHRWPIMACIAERIPQTRFSYLRSDAQLRNMGFEYLAQTESHNALARFDRHIRHMR